MDFLVEIIAVVAAKVTACIAALGYWGVAIGMAIESANIPLPSELILPFGGYLVYEGQLHFWGTALAGALGGTLGSIVSYWLGYYGGRPLLAKYGKYVGFSPKRFYTAEQWFLRYGELTVFFTRLMPIVRTFISLPAGISGMNFYRFVLYTFLGSLPWCVFLTYLGMKLGEHWHILGPWFHKMDVLIVGALLVLVVLYVYHKRSYR